MFFIVVKKSTTSTTYNTTLEIAYSDKERSLGIWNSDRLHVGMTCVGVAKLEDSGPLALMKSSEGFYYAGAQEILRALSKYDVVRALWVAGRRRTGEGHAHLQLPSARGAEAEIS
jgi:hypothetical protein